MRCVPQAFVVGRGKKGGDTREEEGAAARSRKPREEEGLSVRSALSDGEGRGGVCAVAFSRVLRIPASNLPLMLHVHNGRSSNAAMQRTQGGSQTREGAPDAGKTGARRTARPRTGEHHRESVRAGEFMGTYRFAVLFCAKPQNKGDSCGRPRQRYPACHNILMKVALRVAILDKSHEIPKNPLSAMNSHAIPNPTVK